MARGAGSVPPASIVVAVGFCLQARPWMQTVAPEFPNTKFVIVDSAWSTRRTCTLGPVQASTRARSWSA
jgi:basic membrane lipoprotein Med (substrate-binding protein (PBP1-ABC) superfamily)